MQYSSVDEQSRMQDAQLYVHLASQASIHQSSDSTQRLVRADYSSHWSYSTSVSQSAGHVELEYHYHECYIVLSLERFHCDGVICFDYYNGPLYFNCCFGFLVFSFSLSLRCHLRAWCIRGFPRKIIGLYCDLCSHVWCSFS
jgi:hypothetical protein